MTNLIQAENLGKHCIRHSPFAIRHLKRSARSRKV